MNLTEHFTLEELTRSEVASRRGWNNEPPEEVKGNLLRLAQLLEKVREKIGKPLLINSGYRSKIVNDAVGSKETSQHRSGCAADFHVIGMSPGQVVKLIKDSDIRYDQVICEFDSWVHISVPNNANLIPREQALVIDKRGTRPYV